MRARLVIAQVVEYDIPDDPDEMERVYGVRSVGEAIDIDVEGAKREPELILGMADLVSISVHGGLVAR